MMKPFRKAHPCPKCGTKVGPSGTGRYHCNGEDCPVSSFKVDRMGKVYDVVYCSEPKEERV